MIAVVPPTATLLYPVQINLAPAAHQPILPADVALLKWNRQTRAFNKGRLR